MESTTNPEPSSQSSAGKRQDATLEDYLITSRIRDFSLSLSLSRNVELEK